MTTTVGGPINDAQRSPLDAGAGVSITRYDGPGEIWDARVRGFAGSSFCHLSGWRDVIGDVLGHECIYLAAHGSDGESEGVLPLVRVKSPMLGHYLMSMPFLNYGGPLGSNEASVALVEEAVRIAEASGVQLLEVRSRGATPPGPLEPAQRKITVVLELPDDPEVLWKDVLKSKVRSQIRRPQKEGMVIRFGPEEIEPFYQVFASNMRDLGTPVLPRAFFDRIGAAFPEEVEFACVYLGDEPVACGCGFAWQGEFEITWASALREYSRMAPNMLLYWGLMERMTERGLRAFNFGRCTPDGGTHRFKKQWGGEDEPLPWGQWSRDGKVEPPSPDRPILKTAAEVWSRLPLPVANRLGPVLARWLP